MIAVALEQLATADSGGRTTPVGASNPLPVTVGRTSMIGIAPATASVGTGSASLVTANASRRGLVIINLSANTVSLGFGANAAVLNAGITLAAGVAWVMDENTFTTQAVNAIASAGSSVVSVQEFN